MDQYTVSSKTPAILTLRPGNVFHVVRRIILTNRSKFPGTIDVPSVWLHLCSGRCLASLVSPSPTGQNLSRYNAEQHQYRSHSRPKLQFFV